VSITAVAEERRNGGDAHGVGVEHVGRHPAGDLGRDEVLLELLRSRASSCAIRMVSEGR
jgi:hypothetical protein